MLIVGLTGNIGAGKTTAAKMFRQLGAEIIDVDKTGHRLLGNKVIQRGLVSAFGKDILTVNQGINRKKLGKIVFEDFKKLKRLNAIIHPYLIKAVKGKILQKEKRKGVTVVDGALLIEMPPMLKMLDCLILVTIAQAVQMKRLMKNRDGLRQKEIIRRIKAQIPQKKKVQLADYIINNSGTFRETKMQVKKIWKELTN